MTTPNQTDQPPTTDNDLRSTDARGFVVGDAAVRHSRAQFQATGPLPYPISAATARGVADIDAPISDYERFLAWHDRAWTARATSENLNTELLVRRMDRLESHLQDATNAAGGQWQPPPRIQLTQQPGWQRTPEQQARHDRATGFEAELENSIASTWAETARTERYNDAVRARTAQLESLPISTDTDTDAGRSRGTPDPRLLAGVQRLQEIRDGIDLGQLAVEAALVYGEPSFTIDPDTTGHGSVDGAYAALTRILADMELAAQDFAETSGLVADQAADPTIADQDYRPSNPRYLDTEHPHWAGDADERWTRADFARVQHLRKEGRLAASAGHMRRADALDAEADRTERDYTEPGSEPSRWTRLTDILRDYTSSNSDPKDRVRAIADTGLRPVTATQPGSGLPPLSAEDRDLLFVAELSGNLAQPGPHPAVTQWHLDEIRDATEFGDIHGADVARERLAEHLTGHGIDPGRAEIQRRLAGQYRYGAAGTVRARHNLNASLVDNPLSPTVDAGEVPELLPPQYSRSATDATIDIDPSPVEMSTTATASTGAADQGATGRQATAADPAPDMPGRARRVLFTGSRSIRDPRLVQQALKPFAAPGVVLVVGDAKGGDKFALDAWKAWGLPFEQHRKDFRRDGNGAGFRRDERMVDTGADACVAIIHNKSQGATTCAERAEAAGITTYRMRVTDPPADPSHRAERPPIVTTDITRPTPPSTHRASADTPTTEPDPAEHPSAESTVPTPDDGSDIAAAIARAGLGEPRSTPPNSATLTPPTTAPTTSTFTQHSVQEGLEAW